MTEHATTCIDAAQDALLSALRDALSDSGSGLDPDNLVDAGRIGLGWPVHGPDELWSSSGDWVWITESVEDWTMDWSDLPSGNHSEDFTLTVTVAAVRPKDDSFRGARDRCIEIVRAVGAVLASDPRLGGAVLEAHPAGGRMSGGRTDKGRVAQVDLAIRVSAYPAD